MIIQQHLFQIILQLNLKRNLKIKKISRMFKSQLQLFMRQGLFPIKKDRFVKIRCANQTYTSQLLSNVDLNPKWNQSTQFKITNTHLDHIEIQLHDQIGIIGNCTLNLRELFTNNLNEWFSITDQKQITASIRLTFTFQQTNKIQKCLESLQNLHKNLEFKLKQSRIASPTVGSVQLMHQYLNKHKTNSNIINSEYQVGYEFEAHTMKGLLNDIRTLSIKFRNLQQPPKVQTQKLIAKQREVAELRNMVQQKQDEINQQINLLNQITQEQTQLNKKDLILLKYQKKANTLVKIKSRLNEQRHIEKRCLSLTTNRQRIHHSDFQTNSLIYN